MMKSNQNILTCTSVRFYCLKDEDAFFEWIAKINCIDKTSGIKEDLYLHISANNIHDSDLRDLIGLFYRYKINMKQLARFLTNQNKHWFFDSPKGYWHRKVFGVKNKI